MLWPYTEAGTEVVPPIVFPFKCGAGWSFLFFSQDSDTVQLHQVHRYLRQSYAFNIEAVQSDGCCGRTCKAESGD